MSPLLTLHAWILSAVILFGATNASFAQHHGGGGHHAGGGGAMHHGGGGMGGGSVHHHSGGSYYGGGGGYYGGGFYGGGIGYPGYSTGFGYPGYNSGYGYRSYGYGPRGYGTGLGIGIYSSPGYYYSNPGYVTPQYATPVYTSPSSVIVIPNTTAAPPRFNNGPIVITNAATNDKPTEYTLNGLRFSINPGQSQRFSHDRDWIVEFDRGDGRSLAMYGLKSATYKFKMTDKGWELFEAANAQPSVSLEPANDSVTIRPKSADAVAPKPGDDPTTVVPPVKAPKVPDEEAPKPDVQSQ